MHTCMLASYMESRTLRCAPTNAFPSWETPPYSTLSCLSHAPSALHPLPCSTRRCRPFVTLRTYPPTATVESTSSFFSPSLSDSSSLLTLASEYSSAASKLAIPLRRGSAQTINKDRRNESRITRAMTARLEPRSVSKISTGHADAGGEGPPDAPRTPGGVGWTRRWKRTPVPPSFVLGLGLGLSMPRVLVGAVSM